MVLVLAFLLALVAAVVGITLHLMLRERTRRLHSDGAEGMLIEQQRSVQAARMRVAYTSASLHHGTGLLTDEVYRQHS